MTEKHMGWVVNLSDMSKSVACRRVMQALAYLYRRAQGRQPTKSPVFSRHGFKVGRSGKPGLP